MKPPDRKTEVCCFHAQIIMGTVDVWLPLCIIHFEVTFLDAVVDSVELQWFSKTCVSPCGYIDHDGMTVSH